MADADKGEKDDKEGKGKDKVGGRDSSLAAKVAGIRDSHKRVYFEEQVRKGLGCGWGLVWWVGQGVWGGCYNEQPNSERYLGARGLTFKALGFGRVRYGHGRCQQRRTCGRMGLVGVMAATRGPEGAGKAGAAAAGDKGE